MARKLFDTIKAAATASPAPPGDAGSDVTLPRIRSARALRGGLMEISANSVRDLDTSAIFEDGPRDRLSVDPGSIEDLIASMREHGQQVPILVRPTEEPDRYRVVYGRRRLEAARRLGISIKALVRNLDDTASVVAQGQENSLRLNPSFIEKAVFASALREAGYESSTIQAALGINRQALSFLGIVRQSIPIEVIEAIGAAHDVGRRRWTELADLARGQGVDLLDVLGRCAGQLAEQPSSEARFEAFFTAASQRRPTTAKRPAVILRSENGEALATLRRGKSDLSLAILTKDKSPFGDWIERNAEDVVRALYSRWLAEQEPPE